jgi:hypothetical protein
MIRMDDRSRLVSRQRCGHFPHLGKSPAPVPDALGERGAVRGDARRCVCYQNGVKRARPVAPAGGCRRAGGTELCCQQSRRETPPLTDRRSL